MKLYPKIKWTPLAFISLLVCKVIKEFPLLNSTIDEASDEIILFQSVNLGIAMATPEGLVVPVIKCAEKLSISELAEEIHALSIKIQNHKVLPSDLKGGTFTITSLGKLGGLMATPIIKFPESGILSVHAIRTIPRYIKQKMVPRKILNLSISLDYDLSGARSLFLIIK